MPVSLHKVYAGSYWSDAGALMGVLPWSIWSAKIETDPKRRLQMALNLLLIDTGDRKILVDTGLGNRLTEKQLKIYSPSEFMLPVSLGGMGIRDIDVTDVLMTHLHFDHAGGIVSKLGEVDRLTFPNARYWVNRQEWDMAKKPDALNKAAYNFEQQLSLLETTGQIELVENECNVTKEVVLKQVGGHTIGSQIVEIDTGDRFYIYAGDIVATRYHIFPPVTSAYDVSREQSFEAKRYIYEKLKSRDGFLLLDHDNDDWEIPSSELPIIA